jgi:hypothetical protein
MRVRSSFLSLSATRQGYRKILLLLCSLSSVFFAVPLTCCTQKQKGIAEAIVKNTTAPLTAYTVYTTAYTAAYTAACTRTCEHAARASVDAQR